MRRSYFYRYKIEKELIRLKSLKMNSIDEEIARVEATLKNVNKNITSLQSAKIEAEVELENLRKKKKFIPILKV
jgi:septal ring factor EnvC (AmiA/AmiB activator)